MNVNDKKKNIQFTRYLFNGDIVFYGYREKKLPDAFLSRKSGRLSIFLWGKRDNSLKQSCFPIRMFDSLVEAEKIYQLSVADIRFLDHESIKTLFARLPGESKYYLIRIAARRGWIIGILGLIWRFYKNQIKFEGIIVLESKGIQQRWLVIKNIKKVNIGSQQTSLSDKVGIQGLLDYLRKEKIQYVVSRFYQKLPKLYREGGDVDILVADKDQIRIHKFLREHPGSISIGVSSVSNVIYSEIPYYPPFLARKILKSAIIGGGGARIPSSKEAFLSFAYHVLYHKGPSAGVPTQLPNIIVNECPYNDYTNILLNMTQKLNIKVNIDMESLDEYLHSEGWRPKLDTLAHLAPKNIWVQGRFFNIWIQRRFFPDQHSEELGLGVFIIKEKAFELGVEQQILDVIKKNNFIILEQRRFSREEKIEIAEQLRGGVWSQNTRDNKSGLPELAILVFDKDFKSISKTYLDAFIGKYSHPRLRKMKEKLRRNFDIEEKDSLIHSTDSTYESWEYVEVCFPERMEKIKNDIMRRKSINDPLHFIRERARFFRAMVSYYHKTTKIRLREMLVSWLVY